MSFSDPDSSLADRRPEDYIGLATVEIKGLTGAATYPRLDLALDALAGSLRDLPLSAQDHATFQEFFSPAGRRRIAHHLIRTGETRTLAFLGTEAHTVRIRATNPPRPGADDTCAASWRPVAPPSWPTVA
ncbi:hypothetical protein GCM10018781_73410 [Kitasatospora indigofera]|uniref:Uncharacterized protein n=1 Tax=Kitasatospora indigofera TaxID=67307 RepID=A0A919GHS9_9ACTN|nr:hypothetical protein [Kitasatospora indigofera]GHH84344.1 hypothetical protein GCM10018781_73410 [Kitasatospora indigofera]